MGNPKTFVTNFPTKIASQSFVGLANDRGFAIIAWFDGDNSTVLPTLTSQYAAGCILINTKHSTSVTTTTAIYVNTGSATTPSWTALTIN